MSKKLLFKGGHRTGMTPYEIEDFLSLYMRDARVDEKTKAYIDSVIGNSVLNLCPYRNVLVTHKYDTVEGNVVTLDDCQDDEIIQLSEIQGNTMVNCNKDTDKELILMPNLDTNGYSNITLTEGIDGGKVDVSPQGNTMVNVCDQEEAVAITKSYTVETSNHIALQGEYDGKCRPNVYGNTLVNLAKGKKDYFCEQGKAKETDINLVYNLKAGTTYTLIRTVSNFAHGVITDRISFFDLSYYEDGTFTQDHNCSYKGNGVYVSTYTPKQNVTKMVLTIGENNIDKTNGVYPTITISDYMILEGDYTNKPIPDYFTGMKSSFEDKLIPENLSSSVSYNGGINKKYTTLCMVDASKLKRNTIYTTFIKNDGDEDIQVYSNDTAGNFNFSTFTISAKSSKVMIISTKDSELDATKKVWLSLYATETLPQNISAYLVEGDYTNYDFTDYDPTKGGKYKVNYKVTGKNKFPPCPTTSVSGNGITFTYDATTQIFSYKGTATNTSAFISISCPDLKLLKNKTYLFNVDKSLNNFSLQITELGVGYNCNLPPNATATPIINLDKYIPNAIMLYSQNLTIGQSYSGTFKVQIEEGTTATTYEPYKESIKTLYLNSPLLEGDTIEQSGNNIIHNHRYGKVVLDGSNYVPTSEKTLSSVGNYRWRFFKSDVKNSVSTTGLGICDKYPIVSPTDTWSSIEGITQNNDGNKIVLYLDKYKDGSDASKQALINELSTSPITFVYELTTPTQEIISPNDNLLLDSYTNGHLDVDSVVPIDKVMFKYAYFKLVYLYPSTQYKIQFESDNIGILNEIALGGQRIGLNVNIVKGLNIITGSTGTNTGYNCLDMYGIGFNASKIVVTPKVDNNFGYFKGMKSVGECEGNKIEILSNNKNLLNNLIPYPFDIIRGDFQNNSGALLGIVKVKPNTTYIMSATRDKKAGRIVAKMSNRTILPTELPNGTFSQDAIYDFLKQNYANGRKFEQTMYSQDYIKFTTFNDCNYLYVNVDGSYDLNKGDKVTINNVQIEEIKNNSNTPTPYTPHKSNKKEILLNEPLRGLPNGVKDKYVIIDGKWYIERNTIQRTIDGNEPNVTWKSDGKWDNVYRFWSNNFPNCIVLNPECVYMGSYEKIYQANAINVHISTSKIAEDNVDLFVEYLKKNPITLVYQLDRPTYEEVDYNPFEVYTDTTHISNNSTIPCNMVIRNSGFNCILKPNTTYTVSSNNGLSTVTTKDSIGDSILRFYNKDTSITKMNNVLVLEGDYITGNPPIPAFFEGMESVFEQELVTDEKDEHYGKYKVTVKAVGKNLFNCDNTSYQSIGNNNYYGTVTKTGNSFTYQGNKNKADGNFGIKFNNIKLKPNTTYYLSYNYKNINADSSCYIRVFGDKFGKIQEGKITTFTTVDEEYYNFNFYGTVGAIANCQFTLSNIQIEEGTKATEYEPYKENNITFYLKEPLRGVGNVKDKVYVKEDKVVVERNCSSATFDGSDDEEYVIWKNNSKKPTQECFILAKSKTHMPNIAISPNGYSGLNYISNNFMKSNVSQIGFVMQYYGDMHFGLPKAILQTQDIAGFKQWLQQNPTTVVYQLATPVYEEVECDLSKLALEGYNHGTLFYNSNIPVTTQFYDFKVNIKDMLIPNETYYITFIADRVKDITINLSGVQVNYKTSMGYNKVPVQLGDVVNTNFSMDSRGVELSDLMISTSTSLIYVKDMNDVCIYDEASNKYSVTITSTGGNESDKRVILLDYPLLRLNKDIYDRLYYNNKDSRYRIDKKVFKHKFTNDSEYNKYAAETNDTYYSSFISLNESIKDYVVITNEKVKTVKVEDDKYYFKIKWSDLGVSDKTEANGNQGMKDFFNNNEVYLYYATDGFVEIVDGLRRQTLKVYQPETTMNFLGNTTTTVTIVIPKKNI